MITLAATGNGCIRSLSFRTVRTVGLEVTYFDLACNHHDCSAHRNSFISFPVLFRFLSLSLLLSSLYTVFFSHYSASEICSLSLCSH
jgi:hypothetical protein